MAPKKGQQTQSAARSITDFFPRMSASQPSSSQTMSSSQPIKQRNLPPRADQEVISISSASHITVSSGAPSVISVSDASSKPNGRATCDLLESISTRGPARGPAHYHVAPASTAKSSSVKQSTKNTTASKASFKRKIKPDSDSEIEQIDRAPAPKSPVRTRAVAQAVTKPPPFSSKENLTHQLPQANVRKKPRLSSPDPLPPVPEPIAPSDPGDLVPSSQSDEQEDRVLRPPTRDPLSVMEDVDRWRNQASSPLSLPPSDFGDMDVDEDYDDQPSMPLILFPDTPVAVVSTREPSPEPQQERFLTPPPRQCSLPVTPVALTEASKTAKIIADIKARAAALAMSSPEQSPILELKELEDSSDEEEQFFVPRCKPTQDPFNVASTSKPAGRYSLRDRGTSSVASTSRRSLSPSSSRRSRGLPPPRGPVILTKDTFATKKVIPMDPLGALLKEKARADKGGKGSDAFRLAEDTMQEDSEMPDEGATGTAPNWTDEAAAHRAVQKHSSAWLDGSGPSDSDSDEVSLNDDDRRRLLGEKRGKAVVGILDSDRAKKEAAKGKQKVRGVPLWEDDSSIMDTDVTIPSLDDSRGHPILTLLKSRIDNNDVASASLFLSSGLFANLDLTKHENVIHYLCDLALSPRQTLLTTAAFHALSHIWLRPSVLAAGMPFRSVHATCIRLGAKQSAMDAMGWADGPNASRERVSVSDRDDVLYRLVCLLTMSIRSGQQLTTEAPDFLTALILVGIDPSSSPDLQRDIMIAVDLLCQSLAPNTDVSVDLETTICNRLIKFTSELDPINKAQVVSLLAGGSGRTARIARWVAHSIIAGTATLSVEKYNDLPPLMALLGPLASSASSLSDPSKPRIRGIFELHEDTDYVNLGFYVQILAVAISNVEGYVREEPPSKALVPKTPESPGKPSTEKTDTLLMVVRSLVEGLHGRIVDTRAAHLDRSRTKAALKELSMRIFYQQKAVSTSKGNPKKIQQYFPKSTS
ncbi:hypothetical protein C8J57DRAFT_1495884 [Mycena rebaudengoi]|nr:hypothetical protein C8J57DRAFT_1495884 [Mycena rebaudengoi]